jgi:hypothetical protein
MSTLLTHLHHVLDVFAGAALAIAAMRLLYPYLRLHIRLGLDQMLGEQATQPRQ